MPHRTEPTKYNIPTVTVEPLRMYQVRIGGRSLGVFMCESKWEGFMKLKGDNGEIITSEPGFVESIFTGPTEVSIAAASPSVWTLMHEKEPAK